MTQPADIGSVQVESGQPAPKWPLDCEALGGLRMDADIPVPASRYPG
jgi:hypothetical protein